MPKQEHETIFCVNSLKVAPSYNTFKKRSSFYFYLTVEFCNTLLFRIARLHSHHCRSCVTLCLWDSAELYLH